MTSALLISVTKPSAYKGLGSHRNTVWRRLCLTVCSTGQFPVLLGIRAHLSRPSLTANVQAVDKVWQLYRTVICRVHVVVETRNQESDVLESKAVIFQNLWGPILTQWTHPPRMKILAVWTVQVLSGKNLGSHVLANLYTLWHLTHNAQFFSFSLIKRQTIHSKSRYTYTYMSSKQKSGLWLHIYREQRPCIGQANILQLLIQEHRYEPIRDHITTVRAAHTDAASEYVCSLHPGKLPEATRIQATLTSMRVKYVYL